MRAPRDQRVVDVAVAADDEDVDDADELCERAAELELALALCAEDAVALELALALCDVVADVDCVVDLPVTMMTSSSDRTWSLGSTMMVPVELDAVLLTLTTVPTMSPAV